MRPSRSRASPPRRTRSRGVRPSPGAIRQATEAPEHVLVEREHGLIGPNPFLVWDLLLGPRARFLLGAALLVGCLLWVRPERDRHRTTRSRTSAARAIEHPDPLRAIRDARIDVRVPKPTTPLRLPFLPGPMSNLFHDLNPGVAGLILILSAMVPGTRVGLFAIPGAAIALIGPSVGIPRLGPLDSQMASMALGVGVALLGLFIGRR